MTRTKGEMETSTSSRQPVITQKEARKEPLMYVGPTVNGIGIQNRVYTEIPENTQALLEEIPELKNLFITILEYPDAGRMIREQRGYIYSAFIKALGIKNGGK